MWTVESFAVFSRTSSDKNEERREAEEGFASQNLNDRWKKKLHFLIFGFGYFFLALQKSADLALCSQLPAKIDPVLALPRL